MKNPLQNYIEEKKIKVEKLSDVLKKCIKAYGTAFDAVEKLPKSSRAKGKIEFLLEAYMEDLKAEIQKK